MNIKKMDETPMVIYIKQKVKFPTHEMKRALSKGVICILPTAIQTNERMIILRMFHWMQKEGMFSKYRKQVQ